ncbi:MAG: efflux RND transporter permease subunit [Sphingobacteriales bacterium]|nr:efflux RND transporter permease subunit [Sphingobacteriales bacterium]
METKHKEFKVTSWAINNKLSVYVLLALIAIFGIMNYITIPKEQFPELVIPTIIVNSVYPGTSPSDIENLITRPIEKNIKSINGVKKVTSNSVQDFSSIIVEFDPNYDVSEAKQKVKDAVDKSKSSLPNDMPVDPSVMEIDFSEIPIMNINLYGNMELDKIKHYAEILQDKIEGFKEITRVDIIGALDREIKIDVDMYRMSVAQLTFSDIERAVMAENRTISAGTFDMEGMRRTLRLVGEFKDIETIKNISVTSSTGAKVRLSDVADIVDGYKEQESYARFNGKNVITLNVIKKSGENLLNASDKIKDALKVIQKEKFPENLKVQISGDMSRYTRTTLTDLNNTIILGFIFVTMVLMFFMGLTNAVFVGLSVPISMALAYIVLPGIDFTMNMLVMFSFIFALGIVVDDAIVVIENTHRIFRQGRDKQITIVEAAKYAAGQVFLPVLSGTLTLLAPFFPLLFWPGTIGKFMHYIPATLIITLFASLIVAYVFNPVFAVTFMRHEDDETISKTPVKRVFIASGILTLLGIILHFARTPVLANILIFLAIVIVWHNMVGRKILVRFQHTIIPKTLNLYEKLLGKVLKGRRPYKILYGTIGLFVVVFILWGIAGPPIVFFPNNEPNNVYVYLKLPEGTSISYTDSVTKVAEKKIYQTLGEKNINIESVVTNVARGASESRFDNTTVTSNKAKITINFAEFAKRERGLKTSSYMEKIRQALADIKDAEISVEKNSMGPPTGKPVNIEVTAEDLEELIVVSEKVKDYIDSLNIPGIEPLKSDFETNKPELIVVVDRERANSEGITSGQVGMEVRTAVQGKEISKFRDGEDQYPIVLRFKKDQREDVDNLLNTKLNYMDMVTGRHRSIPLSTVAHIEYKNSYGSIHRKNLKRVINLTSVVKTGYNANEIRTEIIKKLKDFKHPETVDIQLTGEREDQQATMNFLGKAMILSVFLIFFILVTQFSSLTRTMIILTEILFSIIGVMIGFMIFQMPFSIAMSGMGVVALGGIVVRNGILMVEFIDALRKEGVPTIEAIIRGSKIRITPIMLTATAGILGLIPLAIGFNIDFVGLFAHLAPHIHFGGDNVTFFGPLSWTIIFGLLFATFLTLFMVPVLYRIYVGRKDKALS